ncbi:MAG: hypothetical protein HKL95_11440 [Phycisphaerae bacterium]|nr:hypothetical protein [Phycisphaerae bacterium]
MNSGLKRLVMICGLSAVLLGLTAAKHAAAALIRISCVGDSITQGIVPNPQKNAWPVVLGRILGHGYRSINCGHSGATMLKKGDLPYWKQPEYKKAIAFHPNIVVIMLGTNDTKPWNWNKHGQDFLRNTETMIRVFQALPTHPRVYICLPPKVVKPAYGINEKTLVTGVIPAIRKAARATHITIINVFGGLPGKMKYYDHDGVHPNIKGEAIMARIIAKVIKRGR